jgi:hypothetical protein
VAVAILVHEETPAHRKIQGSALHTVSLAVAVIIYSVADLFCPRIYIGILVVTVLRIRTKISAISITISVGWWRPWNLPTVVAFTGSETMTSIVGGAVLDKNPASTASCLLASLDVIAVRRDTSLFTSGARGLSTRCTSIHPV